MAIKSEPYLSDMIRDNLYIPSDMYNIKKDKLVKSLDTVLSFLTNDTRTIENTLLDRALSSNTKLEEIASIQLSKAFLERVNGNLRTNYLPTVEFDYDKLALNKPLSYWKITKTDDVDSVSKLIQVMRGTLNIQKPIRTLESFDNDYEKHNNYLFSTLGDGQKRIMMDMLSKNKFNPIDGTSYGSNPVNVFNGKVEGSIKNNYNDILSTSRLSNGYSYDPNNIGDRINPATKAFTIFKQDGTTRLISKGNAVTENDTSDQFLRTFTVDNQYDSYAKAMKYEHGRLGENSVLQKVVPNIFPTSNTDQRKLMFSITNLAQNNKKTMWFPPYNININENVSNNLVKIDFIGRNEPIYTYAGTERKCTLSFTLIADYPAELNNIKKWSNASNNDFSKFFITDNFVMGTDKDDSQRVEVENAENRRPQETAVEDYGFNKYTTSNSLKYYFDNDNFTIKPTLTQDDGFGTGTKSIEKFNENLPLLADFLNSEFGKYYRVVFDGNSSSAHNEQYNDILSYKRAYNVYKLIFSKMNDKSQPLIEFNEPLTTSKKIESKYLKNERFTIKARGESNSDKSINDIKLAIKDRYVAMYLELDPSRVKVDEGRFADDTTKTIDKQSNISDINTVGDFYFEDRPKSHVDNINVDYGTLEKSLIRSYANNVKYFSPVFHSQTPVDLNERLTFLQQCCRQGNSYLVGTQNSSSINPDENIGNSIFGRPPVCILRLGDFMNTKFMIESMDIDYDPLIWDVNPEGIGMQPMLANITLSCVIIGGSSLKDPIAELQNGLSRNYYANTEFINNG